jgi:cathepsin A (carboxypeptidase C)
MFYWLFESKNEPDTDPLLIYLSGGPGCASTGGLFTSYGPFYVEEYYPDPITGKYIGTKKPVLEK